MAYSKTQNTEHEQTLRDATLVQGIRQGDPKAFEDLFYAYCASLVNFAQRFLVDRALAESVVQDVFVNTWKHREQLDPAGNIRAYLFTAVRNQALKQLRRTEVEQLDTLEPSETISQEAAPDEQWTREELAQAIQTAVERLPKRCRTIFVMNRYERLTYKEIARILGLSIKTVETQMGRALRILRRDLAHLSNSLL